MYILKKFPRKLKFILIIIPLFLIYISLCSIKYASIVSYDLKNSILRLHIIANSDSNEDQELKYKIRDNILNYMNTLCLDINSKEEAISIANSHLDTFKKIALDTIKENGFNYDVSVEINNVFFPTKTYGDISLPEGYYDALRIKIGDSNGKNWWCVMFPPLCFIDISSGIIPDESKSFIKENLNSEEYNLITIGDNSNSEINFKFKLIELLNHNHIFTAKN